MVELHKAVSRAAHSWFGPPGGEGGCVKVIDATTLHSDPRPTRRLRHSDITPGDPRPSHPGVGYGGRRAASENKADIT